MNAPIRYAFGLCLQVVGLLNFVFLVGVPIWWAGRRLCRDARTADRSPSLGEQRSVAGDVIGSQPNGTDPSGDGGSSSTRPPEPRSDRRAPVQRN